MCSKNLRLDSISRATSYLARLATVSLSVLMLLAVGDGLLGPATFASAGGRAVQDESVEEILALIPNGDFTTLYGNIPRLKFNSAMFRRLAEVNEELAAEIESTENESAGMGIELDQYRLSLSLYPGPQGNLLRYDGGPNDPDALSEYFAGGPRVEGFEELELHGRNYWVSPLDTAFAMTPTGVIFSDSRAQIEAALALWAGEGEGLLDNEGLRRALPLIDLGATEFLVQWGGLEQGIPNLQAMAAANGGDAAVNAALETLVANGYTIRWGDEFDTSFGLMFADEASAATVESYLQENIVSIISDVGRRAVRAILYDQNLNTESIEELARSTTISRDGEIVQIHLSVGWPDLEAFIVRLDCGEAVPAAAGVEVSGEVDGTIPRLYRYDLEEGGRYLIYTSGDTDTYGALLDSDCERLVEDDDGGEESNFSISMELAATTYFVAVRGYEEGTAGPFTLFFERLVPMGGDDCGSAHPLAAGEEVTGALAGTTQRYFRFEVEETGHYRIASGGDSDTFGTLLDVFCQEIATDDDGGEGYNFMIERPLAAGTYYLAVRGYDESVAGPITLVLEAGPGGAETGERCEGALPLVMGEPLEIAVEGTSERFFRFEVAEGSHYSISTGGGTDTFGTLFDSGCSELASDDDGGENTNFKIELQLAAGTYYVAVRGYNDLTSGTAILYVQAMEPPESCDDARPLAVGQAATAEVDGMRDRYYRFEISEAGPYRVSSAGELDTFGTLYDGFCQELASDDDGEGANFAISRLLPAGTYYVAVRGFDSSTLGSVTLLVGTGELDEDACGAADVIETGQEVTVEIAGTVETYYRFEVTEPGFYGIGTSGETDTYGTLLDGLCNELAFDDDTGEGTNFLIERELAVGTYHVAVRGFSESTEGSTALLVAPADLAPACADAQPLTLGLPQTVGIAGMAESYYGIRIAEPGLYTVSSSGELDTYGTLLDEFCQGLAKDDDGGEGTNFRIDRRLAAGNYYVAVRGFGESTEGQATLLVAAAEVVGGDCTDARTLALGQAYSGSLAGTGQQYFAIEISEGGLYRVSTAGDIDTVGALLGGDCEEIAGDDDGGEDSNFLIVRTLEPGRYYVSVRGFSSSTSGEFVLAVNAVETFGGGGCADAAPIGIGEVVTGSLAGPIERFFSFEIESPGPYRIRSTGNADAYGILIDSFCQEIAADDDSGDGNNFSIERTMPAGGYYLAVRGVGGEATGTVTLLIEPFVPEEEACEAAAPLEIGSETTVAISGQAELYFAFRVEEPASYRIFSTGELDTNGTLLDGFCQEIASDDDGGEGNNFEIGRRLAAGTYHLAVRGYSDTTQGETGIVVTTGEADGGECADAPPLAIGLAQGGVISGTEQQYFRLEISSGGFYAVYTTGRNDTYGTLLDEYCQELVTNDDGGEGYNFRISEQLEPGTYYVAVRGYSESASGEYSLIVEPVELIGGGSCEDATTIELGGELSGALAGRQLRYFGFRVSDPGPHAIYSAGEIDTYGTLLDEFCQELVSDDDGGGGTNFRIERNLAAGSYYIAVRGYGEGIAGTFTMYAEALVPAEDLCAGAEPIEPGAGIRVLVEGMRERYFSFELAEPAFYRVFSTGELDTYGTLLDQYCQELASDDDGGEGANFSIERRLHPGTYKIAIRGYGDSTYGTATLQLAVLGAAEFDCSGAMPVDIGREQAATLSAGSSYFGFRIDEPGLYAIYSGGRLDTYGTLLDELCRELESNDDGADGINFRILRELEPGTYYLAVRAAGVGAVGDFSVKVEMVTPFGGPSLDEAERIEIGGEATGSLAGRQLRFFRFSVEGADRYRIFTSGTSDTVGVLLDGFGQEIESDDDSGEGANFLVERMLAPGNYFVSLRGYGESTFGETTLHVQSGAAAGAACREAAAIDIGTPVIATLEGTAEIYLVFEVAEPGAYSVGTTGDLDTYGTLLDGLCAEIAFDDDGGEDLNFKIDRTLAAGTYYVAVRGFDEDTVGAATLLVATGTAPGAACADALPIDIGRQTGIELAGTAERYCSFGISEPGNYAVGTYGGLDTVGTLLDEFCQELASDDDGGQDLNFRIERLLVAGTYYVAVSGYGDEDTGEATLLVERAGEGGDSPAGRCEDAPTLSPDDSVTVVVAGLSEQYFRLLIEEGGRYAVFTSGDVDTFGTLLSERCDEIDSDDDGGDETNFRIVRDLDAGTYHVAVRGYDEDEEGQAILTIRREITRDEGCDAATPVAPGQEWSGNLQGTTELYFTFEVPVPGFYRIFTTGDEDTVGTLLDGFRYQIAENYDGGGNRNFLIERNLVPGTYYVSFQGYSETDTGPVSFWIEVYDVQSDR